MNSKKTEAGPGPRDYKVSDIKRLFTFSRNQCTKPECHKKLIAEDGKTVIAKICHIEAARKGGPRFRESMDDDERRSYENLILLCDEHHQIIDKKENEKEYPPQLLRKWKAEHVLVGEGTEYLVENNLIDKFIKTTKEYYKKIDSIDGPYEPVVSNVYVSRDI